MLAIDIHEHLLKRLHVEDRIHRDRHDELRTIMRKADHVFDEFLRLIKEADKLGELIKRESKDELKRDVKDDIQEKK